jgi:outer membrane immunogenic protein
MKKLLVVAAGLVLGTVASASAADLAVHPYTKAPPPVVATVYDWSGFYIGANGGWGQAHNCWDFVTVAGTIVPNGCTNQSGGIIGGQFGYRWQTGQFVFGLEGQGDWADIGSSHISLVRPSRLKSKSTALVSSLAKSVTPRTQHCYI